MQQVSKRKNGFVLVVALLIVGIVAIMVAGSLVLSTTNQRINRNDALTSQVLNVAQGGNAYWKAELVSLYQHMSENFELYESAINAYEASGGVISCGNYFAIGLDLDRDGTIDIANPGTLPDVTIPIGNESGTTTVNFSVDGSAIRLEAKGEYYDAKATVVEEFNISNVDIWNNAVFAESSAGQATIQGSAEIRGAVHLLGSGLSSTDIALDLSGSFGLGNTYENLKPSLGVDADEMRLSNDSPEDLCATLRVRAGVVQLGSSGTTIGYDEDTNPDPYVDNLRGVYTNDGFVRKNGGDIEEDVDIFSENGMDAAYDAGDNFEFPFLDDPVSGTGDTWAEQIMENSLVLDMRGITDINSQDDRIQLPIGQQKQLGDGVIYKLSGDCGTTNPMFGVDHTLSNPVLVPNTSFAPFIQPSLTLASLFYPKLTRTLLPALSIIATHKSGHKDGDTGVAVSASTGAFSLEYGKTEDFNCTKTAVGAGANGADKILGEVRWDKDTNTLYINGAVTLLGGDLEVTGGTGNREIVYKGNGVIFAEEAEIGTSGVYAGGDVVLEIDFLPGAGKVPTLNSQGQVASDAALYPSGSSLSDNLYPNTSLLGVVARNTFRSQGSQNRFTLAIYAEESVEITQQTLVAGAIVTQEFDAGSQVPTVLYVPNLSERLPDLMPGAGGNGYAVSNVAWSRSY